MADALRVHVHEIVTSRAFKGSRRSCEFLEYVVEKALTGEFDLLKERTLGVRLFRRDPAYDTGEDAIVRVTASDVRKRLLQFYGGMQTQPDIRIELPSGSYIVQFRYAAPAPSVDPLRTAVVEALPADPAAILPLRLRFSRRVAIGLFLAAIVLVAVAWIGFRHASTALTATNCAPWSAILREDRLLKIVFSDPSIASLQQAFGYQLSLADYAARRYVPDSRPLPPEVARIWGVFRGNNVAAVDATTALRISGLVPPSRIQTFGARTLKSGDFKTDDNFIIMGSPLSNPWVDLFQSVLDFEFRYDPDRHEEVIRNKRPAPGEAAVYAPTTPGWGSGQAYAIAAFLANPNQSGHVMILSGSNAAATEAAGKFVTNPQLVAQTLKAHGLDPYDEQLQFELLLRVTTIATSLNTFDIIGCHRLSPGSGVGSPLKTSSGAD